MSEPSSKYPQPPDSDELRRALAAAGRFDAPTFERELSDARRKGLADAAFLYRLFCAALPRGGAGSPLWAPVIQAGLALSAIPRMEFLPLALAIRRGNQDACVALLDAGADPDESNTQSDPPLAACCKENRLDLFSLMLSRGANPSRPDPRGLSPLHTAAADGRDAFVQALLLAGADPNAKAFGLMTPAEVALDCGYPQTAALIQSRVDELALLEAVPAPFAEPLARRANAL